MQYHKGAKDTGERLNYPHLLLLAGSGRDVGKTLLGCKITASVTPRPIVLKVSSHFHLPTQGLEVLLAYDQLIISREHDRGSSKDTSRYLQSGATSVYYIQCREEALPKLAEWIGQHIPEGYPVICESAALGTVVWPGYAIFIDGGSGKKVPDWPFPVAIMTGNTDIETIMVPVQWRNSKWEKL